MNRPETGPRGEIPKLRHNQV